MQFFAIVQVMSELAFRNKIKKVFRHFDQSIPVGFCQVQQAETTIADLCENGSIGGSIARFTLPQKDL